MAGAIEIDSGDEADTMALALVEQKPDVSLARSVPAPRKGATALGAGSRRTKSVGSKMESSGPPIVLGPGGGAGAAGGGQKRKGQRAEKLKAERMKAESGMPAVRISSSPSRCRHRSSSSGSHSRSRSGSRKRGRSASPTKRRINNFSSLPKPDPRKRRKDQHRRSNGAAAGVKLLHRHLAS